MISRLMYKPHITCLSKDILVQNGKTLTTDTLINKSLTNGSEVYCIDTSECYLYDEENKTLIKTKVNSDIVIDGEITPESVNIINTKVDNFINDVNERIAQADIDKVVELGEKMNSTETVIGSEEMGTTAITIKGAIAEHTTKIDENTQNITNHENETVTELDGAHGLKIETGTFSPIIFGEVQRGNINYSIQKGSYYKINKHVWCDLFVKVQNFTEMSGNIRIGGLPFPVDGNMTSATIGLAHNIVYSSGYTQTTAACIEGQNSLYLFQCGNSKSVINLNETHLLDGCEFKISLNYNVK